MTNVKKIFYFFYQYCQIVSKRGFECSGLKVTVAVSFFYILRL